MCNCSYVRNTVHLGFDIAIDFIIWKYLSNAVYEYKLSNNNFTTAFVNKTFYLKTKMFNGNNWGEKGMKQLYQPHLVSQHDEKGAINLKCNATSSLTDWHAAFKSEEKHRILWFQCQSLSSDAIKQSFDAGMTIFTSITMNQSVCCMNLQYSPTLFLSSLFPLLWS